MREAGFSGLNGAGLNLETGKQTKIEVEGLRTILRIGRFGRGNRGNDGTAQISVVFAANSVGYG
jgi:hypothetical protein